MDNWEHGTLLVSARLGDDEGGTIDFISADEDRTISEDGYTLREQMKALNVLSSEGWEPVGPSTAASVVGGVITTYLLRRAAVTEQAGQVPTRIR